LWQWPKAENAEWPTAWLPWLPGQTVIGFFIGQLGRRFTLFLLEEWKLSQQDMEAAVTKGDVSVLWNV
jgi:hypothetical protein